jgi:hypothetical protein
MKAIEVKKLLEPIPSEDFIVGKFTDEIGKCCAVGHIQRLTSDNRTDYSTANCTDRTYEARKKFRFRDLTTEYIQKFHQNYFADLSDVNNRASVNGYNEETPKARVMHLLDDMIAEGY